MSTKILQDVEYSTALHSAAARNFEALEGHLGYFTTPDSASSGAPSSGAHYLHELWIDSLNNVWRCTAAGTPGTWELYIPKDPVARGSSATITGLWTFDRGSGNAPFAVGFGAAKVTGLDADLLDGKDTATAATANTVALRDANGNLTAASPSDAAHLATKGYVDATAQGLRVLDPCRVATTANITLSGTQTIDGVSVAADESVCVKNQTTQSENGIYLCKSGSWERRTDADSTAELDAGAYTTISEGTVNGGSSFVQQTDNPTIGTDAIVWKLFNKNTLYTSGNGIDITSTTISVKLGGSTTYTQGGVVWCDSSSTLNKTAALSGILQGNGTSAPTAITGTSGRLSKWSSSAPYLADSIIAESGQTLTLQGGASTLATATGNLVLGPASSLVVSPLAGTGTRMVTAAADGTLGSTAIPAGTVTSVGLSMPAQFTVTNSPVTSSGTLTAAWASAAANAVFAGPNGSTGTPTFRALAAADIPSLGASKITSETLAAARLGSGTASATVFLAGDSAWKAVDWTHVANKPSTFTPAGHALSSHSDVSITTPASGQFLKWNGSEWINAAHGLTYSDVGAAASDHLHTGVYEPVFSKGDLVAGTNIALNGTLAARLVGTGNVTVALTGTVAVANGGSGAATLTGLVAGNGASAMTAFVGTENRVLKWSATSPYVTNSVIRDDGSGVGIGGAVTASAAITVHKASTYNSESGVGIYLLSGATDTALLLGADAANDLSFLQSMQSGTAWSNRPLVLQPNGGNVGISTATPGAALEVASATGINILASRQSDTVNSYVNLRRARAANANLAMNDIVGQVQWEARFNSTTNDIANLWAVYVGNGTTRYGELVVSLSNSSGPTEVLRIKSDGRFDHVCASTNATATRYVGNGSTDAYLNFADTQIGGQSHGQAFLRWTRDNSLGRAFSVHVSNNEGTTKQALTVTRDGYVGMGDATAPSYGCHLKGAGAAGVLAIERTNLDAQGPAGLLFLMSDAKTTNDQILISFRARDSGNADQEYGRVSAGITSPTAGAESSWLGVWTVDGGVIAERWRVTAPGVLQSAGAQTIQTASGTLTLQGNGGSLAVTPLAGTGTRLVTADTSGVLGTTATSAFGLTLLDDGDAATARSTLGAEATLTKGNLTASGAISISATREVIGGAAAISHLTASGYKHVPSGGASGQFLVYASDGTAAWGSHTQHTGLNLKADGTAGYAYFLNASSVEVGAILNDDSYTPSYTTVGPVFTLMASGLLLDSKNNTPLALNSYSGGVVNLGGRLNLVAGTTTKAPLLFTSGSLLTSPVHGAVEYDGTNLWWTNASLARSKIVVGDNGTYSLNISGNAITAGTASYLASMGTSTGFAVQTASGTWAARSIEGGSSITVTNGNGVSGNPSVVLDSEIFVDTIYSKSASPNTLIIGNWGAVMPTTAITIWCNSTLTVRSVYGSASIGGSTGTELGLAGVTEIKADTLKFTHNTLGFFSAGSWATKQPVADPAAFGNTDNEIGALTISAGYSQAEVQALRDKCEELADDCRALRDKVKELTDALQAYNLV